MFSAFDNIVFDLIDLCIVADYDVVFVNVRCRSVRHRDPVLASCRGVDPSTRDVNVAGLVLLCF